MHTACNRRSHMHSSAQDIEYLYCSSINTWSRYNTSHLSKHVIANWTTRWNTGVALQSFKIRSRQVSLSRVIMLWLLTITETHTPFPPLSRNRKLIEENLNIMHLSWKCLLCLFFSFFSTANKKVVCKVFCLFVCLFYCPFDCYWYIDERIFRKKKFLKYKLHKQEHK